MKNYASLPSVSSQLYSFGSNEAISDVLPMHMDNEVYVYGSMDSSLYNNQLVGGFDIPSQPHIYRQPGPSSLMTIKRLDYPYLNNLPHQPFSLSKKLSDPHYEAAIQNPRKRPIEVNNLIWAKGSSNEVNISDNANKWKTNKKASISFPKQCHHQAEEESKEVQIETVPMKRSKKLSDKVTALQKLVSPYGKTDTASVLEEASISIKLLQDQIQRLFHRLNTEILHSQNSGEKQLELRSRGLCLVPVSFTQKLKEQFNGHPVSVTYTNLQEF